MKHNSEDYKISAVIENYFNMLKSRLQKLDGLTHENKKKI